MTALLAGRLAAERGHGGFRLAAAIGALALLFVPFFLFGMREPPRSKGRSGRASQGVALAAAVVLVPYAIYGFGTGAFSAWSLLRLATFALVPALLVAWANRLGPPPALLDAAAVLALWLPVEMGWMERVWTWPDGLGSYLFQTVATVDLALVVFVALRELQGVGYRFALRGRDVVTVLENFAIFAVIAIPLGIATGFIAFHARWPDIPLFVGNGLAILLGIALPEELLFRGLIQNLLQKAFRRTWPALILASLIFGAAHANNGPRPDWRYVLLASIAGVFYGRAYLRSGGLMAAALVHALVDDVWREFFR